MFVTDPDKRKQIGAYYQQAFSLCKEMPVAIHKLHADSDDQSLTSSQTRSASSADYLADHMGDAPVLMIPCIAGRTDNEAGMNILSQTATLVLSFRRLGTLCSRRARGIGTAWTTLHLMFEKEIAELLEIPYEDVMQIALCRSPTPRVRSSNRRRPPVETIMHVDRW